MKKGSIVHDIAIVDIGAKGKVIGKKDGQAFLTKGAIPGDTVSIQVKKNRKNMKEGRLVEITELSPDRVTPRCEHVDHCGGCSWQELDYARQIAFKEQNVLQQLKRIGKLESVPNEPILGAESLFEYRNKLEFTFVDGRWLTPEELAKGDEVKKDEGLGFHVPGRFDWVLHIDTCHLQHSDHNAMRKFLYEEAKALGISFYHPREQVGILRNVIFRNNRNGQWMTILIVKERTTEVDTLLDRFSSKFPHNTSLWLVINNKMNDSIGDLDAIHVEGDQYLSERFSRPDGESQVEYLIGPKSFFQTNSDQAERLYQHVYEWAGLSGDELVYDLYTGTGSIALYVADKARHVVGIEYVEEAIADAKKNAARNGIDHCSFYAGDMKDILTPAFVAQHGTPDVLITDPPRAGMHGDVVDCILQAAPRRIVYVSCDPATQARDIALLASKYRVVKTRAVDMFPHTSHVENIALLEIRS